MPRGSWKWSTWFDRDCELSRSSSGAARLDHRRRLHALGALTAALRNEIVFVGSAPAVSLHAELQVEKELESQPLPRGRVRACQSAEMLIFLLKIEQGPAAIGEGSAHAALPPLKRTPELDAPGVLGQASPKERSR